MWTGHNITGLDGDGPFNSAGRPFRQITLAVIFWSTFSTKAYYANCICADSFDRFHRETNLSLIVELAITAVLLTHGIEIFDAIAGFRNPLSLWLPITYWNNTLFLCSKQLQLTFIVHILLDGTRNKSRNTRLSFCTRKILRLSLLRCCHLYLSFSFSHFLFAF